MNEAKTVSDLVEEVTTYVAQLQAENAKLREELAKARDPQRIGGQADPSSFAYAIEQLREFRWQHATNDEDAIPYINNVAAAHERENAKLREELDQWHSLTAGIELPEYPMTQFQPKDLERENVALRELVRILAYCMSEDRDCDKCVLNGADMPTPRISACDSLPDLMRELRVIETEDCDE